MNIRDAWHAWEVFRSLFKGPKIRHGWEVYMSRLFGLPIESAEDRALSKEGVGIDKRADEKVLSPLEIAVVIDKEKGERPVEARTPENTMGRTWAIQTTTQEASHENEIQSNERQH